MDTEKYIGTVIWFDSKLGYGFIAREGDRDLFVYWSDVSCDGYKTLKKGQQVAYSIGLNKNNKPKAIDVVVVNEDSEKES